MNDIVSTLSVEEINRAGDTIIEQAKKMYESLERIKTTVQGSKTCFDSPAGQATRDKFNKTAQEFQTFQEFLKTYGQFCKNFSENMAKAEAKTQEFLNSIPG